MNALAHRRATPVLAVIAAFALALTWLVSAGSPAHADALVTISGQVVLPDGASAADMQGVKVRADRTDAGPNAGGQNTAFAVPDPVTGLYVVTGLNPGTYRVQFYVTPYSSFPAPEFAPEYYNNSYTPETATLVDATDGSAVDVHGVLGWAGTISGTVTLGEGVPAEDMQGVSVIALGAGSFTPADSEVDGDGSYTITGLPAGEYRLFFDGHQYLGSGGYTDTSYRREYFDDVFTRDEATVITVGTHEDVTGKDATLDLLGHFTKTPDPVIKFTMLSEGAVLGLSTGTWAPSPTFTFRWKRDGVSIAGAIHATYEVTGSDVGKNITVTVTGTKAAFTSTSRTSAPVKIGLPFVKTVAPTISGTPSPGKTLTAHRGTWVPSATTNKYQWKRNGYAIPGATGFQYVVKTTDRGAKISVTVTGSRPGYGARARTSAAVYIPKVFTTTVIPTVTGTAKAGYRLTAHRGTWSPTPTYSYQWYRGSLKIPGATSSTYKLTSSDKGKTVRVKVTGKRSGYVTTSKISAPRAITP